MIELDRSIAQAQRGYENLEPFRLRERALRTIPRSMEPLPGNRGRIVGRSPEDRKPDAVAAYTSSRTAYDAAATLGPVDPAQCLRCARGERARRSGISAGALAGRVPRWRSPD